MKIKKCDRCKREIGPTNSNARYLKVLTSGQPNNTPGSTETKDLCLGCAKELDAFFNGEKVYEYDFENEEEVAS